MNLENVIPSAMHSALKLASDLHGAAREACGALPPWHAMSARDQAYYYALAAVWTEAPPRELPVYPPLPHNRPRAPTWIRCPELEPIS